MSPSTPPKSAAALPMVTPHGARVSQPPPTTAIDRFFAWWRRELVACIPEPVRDVLRWVRGGQAYLVASVEDGALQLETVGRRRRAAHGAMDALRPGVVRRLRRAVRRRRLEVVLAAPTDAVVRQKVTLPLTAEQQLAQVLFYELERLTPFRATELYYTYAVLRRRPAAKALDVLLIYAPRADLDRRLWELSSAGLPARRIDVLSREGRPRGHNLLREIVRDGGDGLSRAFAAAATLGLIAICATWVAVALDRRETEVEALRDAVFLARRAALASETRASAAAPEAGAAAEAFNAKQAAPLIVGALADLTEALPDGVWLQTLEVEDGAVEFTGVADDASALIALLDAHPRFEDPAFAAPIRRDAATGEHFTMTARLRGPEAPR